VEEEEEQQQQEEEDHAVFYEASHYVRQPKNNASCFGERWKYIGPNSPSKVQ